jgi:drug/metabolite transporter (DMT)-like permease
MWFALAISAAALWGVTYAVIGRLVKEASVPTLMFLTSSIAAVLTLTYALASRRFLPDMRHLASSRYLLALVAALIVTSVLANVAIMYSIAGRNATLAAIIEIAYPLFTALAVWLLFGEKQLTPSTMVGGLLIFSGALVISLTSK